MLWILAFWLQLIGSEPLPQTHVEGGSVMLTRPDGTPIYVNPNAVAFVRGPLPGEHGDTTIVFSSGGKQTVRESVEQIHQIMELERKAREQPK